jgi:hypothetical protein
MGAPRAPLGAVGAGRAVKRAPDPPEHLRLLLDYVEKVRSQFLSLRQSPVTTGPHCDIRISYR